MKTIKKRWKLILAGLGVLVLLVAVAGMAGHLAGLAAASGIPGTDPLWYSGHLTDTAGQDLKSTQVSSLEVTLFPDATTSTMACTATKVTSPTLTQGRFRLKLDKTCLAAIQAKTDIWVEVKVNGTSMGRTKVGAVPYAVEAKTASALSADPDCPPGFARDATATTITLCKRGLDEMVKVGSFWVDRYEMSIMDSGAYSGGKCNGTGKQYGVSSDDYPTTPGKGFPDSGDFYVPLHACSAKGKKPSAYMTWFQAALACELSGKQLCSNYQWQMAALGTPDDSTSCNISTLVKETAGNRSKCVSRWGALDMVGNLWEWVAWWGQAGKVNASFTSGAQATPWPSGYGDGKDGTWNINGAAFNRITYATGLLAAAARGGSWADGTDAGVFAAYLNSGPSGFDKDFSARCCRQ